MELADGNFEKPFPPPPEETFKVHCYPESNAVKEAWLKIMPNSEFCDDVLACKVLILNEGVLIGRQSADKLLEILARDGREALTYRYDKLEKRFFSCDRVWLEIPGRVIPDLHAS